MVPDEINFNFVLQGNAKLAIIIFSCGQLLVLIGYIVEILIRAFRKTANIKNEPIINFCFGMIIFAFIIFNIVEDFKYKSNIKTNISLGFLLAG